MIEFLKANGILVYVAFLAAVSLVTFVAYAIDKDKARRGAWRIPEKTLLGLSFFGGAAGGYFAMNTVRHKTKKWYCHAVNVIGLAWQCGLLAFLLMA